MTKSNFLSGIFAAVIGLLVLVQPDTSIKVVIIILGMTAIVRGINDLVRVRALSDDRAFKTVVLVRALVSILIGLAAVCLPLAFFNTAQALVRILLYVQAVYMVLSACTALFFLARLGSDSPQAKGFKSDAGLSLVVALFLFLLPANFGVILIRIVGAVLLVSGLGYALYAWRNQTIVVEPDAVQDEAVDVSEDESAVPAEPDE